jgi:hypothetical protein
MQKMVCTIECLSSFAWFNVDVKMTGDKFWLLCLCLKGAGREERSISSSPSRLYYCPAMARQNLLRCNLAGNGEDPRFKVYCMEVGAQTTREERCSQRRVPRRRSSNPQPSFREHGRPVPPHGASLPRLVH